MKKKYITPTVNSIEISISNMILAASGENVPVGNNTGDYNPDDPGTADSWL